MSPYKTLENSNVLWLAKTLKAMTNAIAPSSCKD